MIEENVNTVRVLRGPNITYLYNLCMTDLFTQNTCPNIWALIMFTKSAMSVPKYYVNSTFSCDLMT